MVSKSDMLVGILVLITSQVMLQFTPTSSGGGGLLLAEFGMEAGHYAGSALGVFSGIIGLALYKKVNKVTVSVSVLSILLGFLFLFILYYPLGGMNTMGGNNTMGGSMNTVGGLSMMGDMSIIADVTLLIAVIGIVGSFLKKKTSTN